jgi:alkylation response protein AidB-like acyl-CoA dehydrogenase
MIGPNPSLPALAEAFQSWLDERAPDHGHLKVEPPHFDDKLVVLRELQTELYDAGWARYGWSEAVGGLGGTVLHRALINDLLERNGYPPRHLFEHLEILPPALERFAQPDVLQKLFLPTLRGDVLWCQGFSEPTAGSDLAALKCKAARTEGGYRIDGHKIWTSWAKWATHLLFLARTGSVEDRHRGLSAFVVDINTPGLQVGAIRQSNGHDELAEVFFDDAFVPEEQRVGEEGEGWAVAMHILAGERGSYTWLRQCEMLPRLEQLSQHPGADQKTHLLGDSLIRLLTLRCRSRAVVEILGRGEAPGPESSVTKVLAIDTEQHFYNVAREILSPGIDLGTDDDWAFWQEHYLYSRASSVYGGSKQIQFNVIAKLLISQGGGELAAADDEVAAVRQSVDEAIEQSESGRSALDGLDWWSFAAAPEDTFGRAAFSAWFEGQGSAPTTSPALAGVQAGAIAEALGAAPSEFSIGVRNGDAVLAYGVDPATKWVALEEPDGIQVFAVDGASTEASDAFDTGLVKRLALAGEGRSVAVDAGAHARALDLARIGAAHEILGASRALLTHAIAHTNEREQFGQPISRFQAIQHILSETQIELSALEETCGAALEEWSAGNGHDIGRVAKALAGRSGLTIAQNALQCFGAIGFTEEHVHHLYQKRIHTLDMLLGSYYALRGELGSELVRSGQAPRCIQIWRPEEA